jgi:hypothetical protein
MFSVMYSRDKNLLRTYMTHVWICFHEILMHVLCLNILLYDSTKICILFSSSLSKTILLDGQVTRTFSYYFSLFCVL